MISGTGSKSVVRCPSSVVRKFKLWFAGHGSRLPAGQAGKTGHGFTLIEVLVATAVLSLGSLLVHEAFFSSLDAYNYYNNYLNVASHMNERIWLAQDGIRRFGSQAQIQKRGNFVYNNRNFHWLLSHNLIDLKSNLYKIDIALSWQEGIRKIRLKRTAYARYEE